ncbi:hypothetical protein TNCT_121881 [Trichonephila clavata]|uniref:Uncharacterized protein n=1 Tax=Trichonephila clavata TaxID=2740835 RepID=A0A8X6HA39_TRICU|nr:hypothetical protein TNCT_121881 [Trichonephila clavata]
MNQETTDKRILLIWAWFTIRFLFFNHWDILLLPPILMMLDGFYTDNIRNCEKESGDSDPQATGRTTQEDTKIQDRKHSISLDKLIQKMMEKRERAKSREATDCKQ